VEGSRVFNFPVDVQTDKLEATLEAGLLLLKVPKKHAHDVESTKRVAIKANE
jgi:HSP20 family molecular chaperone IbpA